MLRRERKALKRVEEGKKRKVLLTASSVHQKFDLLIEPRSRRPFFAERAEKSMGIASGEKKANKPIFESRVGD